MQEGTKNLSSEPKGTDCMDIKGEEADTCLISIILKFGIRLTSTAGGQTEAW